MDTEDQNVSLTRLLAAALESPEHAVVARVTANDHSQLVFALAIIEVTVDGVTESFVDQMTPSPGQLN